MADRKEKDKEKKSLANRASGPLSKKSTPLTIGALEIALLKKFPAEDAEEWDRTGLLVGDPTALIEGIALALDPTVEAIREAAALGANVLLTHHPAFLSAPDSFRPASSVAENPGAGVYEAIRSGVALMNFHTALDVSYEAARVLPGMLNLQFKSIVSPIPSDKRKGYGQLCTVRPGDAPLSLGQFAARCTSVFESQPRVWGSFDRELKKIATCTGSAGDLSAACLTAGVDCLVCGEIRYHDALAAVQAGLCVIEVGHDISEDPLVAVLAATLDTLGIPKSKILLVAQDRNWTYPETVRM